MIRARSWQVDSSLRVTSLEGPVGPWMGYRMLQWLTSVGDQGTKTPMRSREYKDIPSSFAGGWSYLKGHHRLCGEVLRVTVIDPLVKLELWG
jgi:hypothetical protein